MVDYLSSQLGTDIDTAVALVLASNLSATHKILRGATIVIAASNTNAAGKAQAHYVCDGTDDDVTIQTAITAAVSGDEILFLEGNYVINTRVTATSKNLVIRGAGTVTFTYGLTVSEMEGFLFTGVQVLSTTLTADAAEFADHVALASVEGLAAGDLITIGDGTTWTDVYEYPILTADTYKVRLIDGSDVYLDDWLVRAYPAIGSTAFATRGPVVSLDNLTFLGQGEDVDYRGVSFKYCAGASVTNCKFLKHGHTSISFSRCYDGTVENNTIEQSKKDGNGYGVEIVNACAKIKIINNQMHRCRHCVSGGWTPAGSSINGIMRDVVIVGNTLSGWIPVDAHACALNYLVCGNVIRAELGVFNDGTQFSIFANNQCFIAPSTGGGAIVSERDNIILPRTRLIRGNTTNNGAIYSNAKVSDIKTLDISGNTSLLGNADMNTINMEPGASALKTVIIKDNIIQASAHYGMYLNLVALTAGVTLEVCGNSLEDTDDDGIKVVCNTGFSNDVKIDNNHILDPNTCAGTTAGITLTGVLYASICNNIIHDRIGNGGTAIRTLTGCNYNIVKNNIAWGMTPTTKISLTGANNTDADNVTW